MNPKTKRRLTDLLGEMDANERQRLMKQAKKMRKEIRRRTPSRYEEDDQVRPRKCQRGPSLEDLMLQLLDHSAEPAGSGHDSANAIRGQVVWLTARKCRVQSTTETLEATISNDLTQRQQTDVAVGDHVWVEEKPEVGRIVTAVEPRRTKLSRPDPGNRHLERVLAANIDVVVMVVSVLEPPLHPRIIDRFLIAIQFGGAEPLLCVNKVDRLDSRTLQERELAKLEPYDAMGLPVLLCSAESGFGVEELRTRLSGRLCTFVGHSGVGKSSLINALAPGLGLETGAVSEGYGRGTHTTVASTLHELPDGLRIVDTPGVRSFGLPKLDADDLLTYFPEFASYASGCRYRNCRHAREPDCAVREASESGRLSRYRHETYLRLLESIA